MIRRIRVRADDACRQSSRHRGVCVPQQSPSNHLHNTHVGQPISVNHNVRSARSVRVQHPTWDIRRIIRRSMRRMNRGDVLIRMLSSRGARVQTQIEQIDRIDRIDCNGSILLRNMICHHHRVHAPIQVRSRDRRKRDHALQHATSGSGFHEDRSVFGRGCCSAASVVSCWW